MQPPAHDSNNTIKHSCKIHPERLIKRTFSDCFHLARANASQWHNVCYVWVTKWLHKCKKIVGYIWAAYENRLRSLSFWVQIMGMIFHENKLKKVDIFWGKIKGVDIRWGEIKKDWYDKIGIVLDSCLCFRIKYEVLCSVHTAPPPKNKHINCLV